MKSEKTKPTRISKLEIDFFPDINLSRADVGFQLTKKLKTETKNRDAEPFVKWAGGKSQLIAQYASLFPNKYKVYHEPFLGGGAVFFYLKPHQSVLSDLNQDLIECYTVVKTQLETLLIVLRKFRGKHGKQFFYHLRRIFNDHKLTSVERAAAFIYLNKACYNGLYRVNRKGEFNVPFGDYKNPAIYDENNLRAVNSLLKSVKLLVVPFENVLRNTTRGDFIYLDPPYFPLTKTANFTSYTKDTFLEKEQLALAEVFRALDKRGCKVMLSNSDTPFIKNIYKDYRIVTVAAKRAINSKGTRRGKITELVVFNYDL